MKPSITGARSELGRELAAAAAREARAAVHVNVAGQQANTLLHDGHAWEDFARTLPSATRRALRAAEAAGARRFVHASFAFVRAVERGAGLADPLRSCVAAILESEAMVLAGRLPACVVRLGYLYGPTSADLRAYRTAFRLGRPYWSGDAGALQHHLHLSDAATALLAAARATRSGTIWYATDGQPASFQDFMDHFARRVGRARPLHLPKISRRLVQALVRPGHVQQTALPMPPAPASPRVPAWRPRFADCRSGLDQVIEAWREESAAQRARR